MRKPLSVFFSIALMFSMLPATAFAAPEPQLDVNVPLTVQIGENIAEGTIEDGTAWGTCPWEISADGVLTVHPGTGENASTKYTVQVTDSYSYDMIVFPWYGYASKVTSVEFIEEEDQKVVAPENCSNLFAGFSNVTSVDLSGLDTSRTTNMSCMFGGGSPNYHMTSSSLLPDGGSISMPSTGCVNLEKLDVSVLNTSNVTNMWGMFSGLRSLKSLDLSNFDTAGVTDMTYMFCGSYSLNTLDLSNFDTANVESMNGMFQACAGLKSLDVSSFDTSKVKRMGQMFEFCGALESLDVSNFNTSRVGEMSNMFLACMSLRQLDVSNFDTSEVYNMWGIFTRCRSLESLDLSSFDTSNATGMSGVSSGVNGMFSDCDSLGTIALGEKTTKLGMLPGYDSQDLTQWKSRETGQWFTSKTIVENRLGVIDTYTRGVHYELLNLSTDTYVQGSGAGVTLRFDGPFEKFDRLVINGTEVPKGKYTARPGSTVVELSDSFIGGLETGEQEVAALYSDGGIATASFTVEIESGTDPIGPSPDDPGTTDPAPKPDDPKPDVPGTDDPAPSDPGTKPSDPGATDPAPKPSDPKPDDAAGPGPVAEVAMWRLYNPNSGEHFYTASAVERDHLASVGWSDEGVGWYAPASSGVPVYRLYNPVAGEHHYTVDAGERDVLVSLGWLFESEGYDESGAAWYSDERKGAPLYREYNPNAYANNHNYTTSQYEFDHNISLGWQDEGIAWYAAAEGGADESDK